MPNYGEHYREQVLKSGATRTFELYEDPGHAWLKVPKKLLRDMGIASQVTPYSYQRGEFAYLEEDQDAPLFIREFEAQYGVMVKFRERVARERESTIRTYEQYDPAEGAPDSVPEHSRASHFKRSRDVDVNILEYQSCPTCYPRPDPTGDEYATTLGRENVYRRVRVKSHFRSKPGGSKRAKYVHVRSHNREV